MKTPTKVLMIDKSWTSTAARCRLLYAERIPREDPVNWILALLRPLRPDLRNETITLLQIMLDCRIKNHEYMINDWAIEMYFDYLHAWSVSCNLAVRWVMFSISKVHCGRTSRILAYARLVTTFNEVID